MLKRSRERARASASGRVPPRAAIARAAALSLAVALAACASSGESVGGSVAATHRGQGGASAQEDAGRGTCFQGMMGNAPWAARAASSTLAIVSGDWTGRQFGTGFVIRGSGAPHAPRNRMLTALHAVDASVASGARVGVLSSSGRKIGWARVIARGVKGQEFGVSVLLPRGDLAVLEMDSFAGQESERAFDAIEGLDLAPVQGTRMLRGRFTNPAAVGIGASGSGVLDRDGRVVGVLVRSAEEQPPGSVQGGWRARLRVPAGLARWDDTTGVARVLGTHVALAQAGTAYVEPLSDRQILYAMGEAGRAVTEFRRVAVPEVTIAGFPSQACVVYRGDLRSAS